MSRILKNVHAAAKDLYDAGHMDAATMRKFDALRYAEIGSHGDIETHFPNAPGGGRRSRRAVAPIGDPAQRVAQDNPVPGSAALSEPAAPIGDRNDGDIQHYSRHQQQPASETSEPVAVASAAAPIGQSERTDRLAGTMDKTRPVSASSQPAPIAAKPARRQRKTNDRPEPRHAASSSAPLAAEKQRQKATKPRAMPIDWPSPSAPNGHASNGAAGDKGHNVDETHVEVALAATVNRIVELQSMRRFCIKSQSRCDRSIEDFIARSLGYSTALTEKERKALFRRAADIRQRVEKGGGDQLAFETHFSNVPAAIIPMILANATARGIWDAQRKEAEANMVRLAMTLPVWPWVQNIKGFGALGLAIVVGEAGIPIGDYRTVSGLWSRLGLAVIAGVRQQRMKGELGKLHKYSPMRRAELWAICSDSMFRHQWRSANEETGEPARPIGLYGEVYARRRAVTEPRIESTGNLSDKDPDKWTKGRCHNDARRIMTKVLMKDLWVEWRRTAGNELA